MSRVLAPTQIFGGYHFRPIHAIPAARTPQTAQTATRVLRPLGPVRIRLACHWQPFAAASASAPISPRPLFRSS